MGSSDLATSYLNDVQVTTGLSQTFKVSKEIHNGFQPGKYRLPSSKSERNRALERISSQRSRPFLHLWRSDLPKLLGKVKALHLKKMQAVTKQALGPGKRAQSDACPGCVWYLTAEVPGSFSRCGKSSEGEACA